MERFAADRKLCTKCYLCLKICPWSAIEAGEEGYPESSPARGGRCAACQQCFALCPEGAISIEGKSAAKSVSPENLPSPEAVEALIRFRRSVRYYKKECVSAAVVDNLLHITANAPTGTNSRKLRFTVLEGDSLENFKKAAYEKIEELDAKGLLPEKQRYLKAMAESWRSGRDVIFRDAPHLLLASSGKTASTPHEDGVIALSYFELMANSAGLGTLWVGFVMHVFKLLPELAGLIGIGEDRHLSYAMLFGYPAIRFRRGVQRDEVEIARPKL
ncbi:nitroreductase [bacterium]|nr:MAG: nitroreductase [bacterium]